MTASRVAGTLRARTAAECARAIREENPRLHALIRVLNEPDVDPLASKDAPLAGVPFVLKDTWDTAGIATTGGSWRHRDRVPARSSRTYEAFRSRGAVLLGKSNLSDLAFSPESANHLGGATRNPSDPSRTSGGSTGGGAAAVAAGLAAFDWGSDFGGSIRMPAGFCGVVGLRLSNASWPIAAAEHFPAIPKFFRPMVGGGPIARSVADCRELLAAVPELREGGTSPAFTTRKTFIYAPDAACTGAWPTFVADASRALLDSNVAFEPERTLPPPTAISHLYNAYLCAHFDAFLATGEISVRQGLPAALLGIVSRGRLDRRLHPHSAILLALCEFGHLTLYRNPERADRAVSDLRTRAQRIWDQGGLIVLPTATLPAPRHGRATMNLSLSAFCKLGNLIDGTSIAIPFGRFDDGLPRSIQVMGPPGSDDAVLDLASQLEWAGRRIS